MTVLVVILAVILVIVAAWAYSRANRLDRLNVRVDLAWQALAAALERRTVVVRVITSWMDNSGDPAVRAAARDLAACADAADRAPRSAREDAENALSRALSRIDPIGRPVGLVAELADAETRVMMARRFYNDAVRDTRSLADRFLVRLLHLGGTAARPEYFEIVERITPGTGG
ncbi:NUDIX hydrolase [Gordonia sp. DT30]|uniref:NUDIX hydrolase n=1 Tax=Gordonia sp. DT30 TaxID=3416546 RepID=UPI003CF75381